MSTIDMHDPSASDGPSSHDGTQGSIDPELLHLLNPTASPERLDTEGLISLYRLMARVRAFEDKVESQTSSNTTLLRDSAQARSALGGSEQSSRYREAICAGVGAHLRVTDRVTSTRSGYGHALAKGANLERLMAERLGKASGFSGGRGGPMSFADLSVGILSANSVSAVGVPMAVGAAHALKLQSVPAIAVSFLGSEASDQASLIDALRWAQAFSLPVLFVCEDDGQSRATPGQSLDAGPSITAHVQALGVEAVSVDGHDLAAVWQAAKALIDAIRRGEGPRLLHARIQHHPRDGLDAESSRWLNDDQKAPVLDPLALCREQLRAQGITEPMLQSVTERAVEDVERAASTAQDAPEPDQAQAFEEVQDEKGESWY